MGVVLAAALTAVMSLSGHPYAHVIGPVIYKHWEPAAVEWSWPDRSLVREPGCWYLGVAAINTTQPSGICVDKATYDRTPRWSWFDGSGYLRWVRES